MPLRAIAAALNAAHRVVVLTGAGVSAESGIPTFRARSADAADSKPAAQPPSSMAALWKEFDPLTLATPEAFAANPERVARWYDWRRQGCLAALPNPGHLALAQLESFLAARRPAAAAPGPFTLLTQNVDRLHQKAGSRAVVELHGNILTWRCTRTGRDADLPSEPLAQFPPPSPHHPQGILRPNVVWFGEMLPPSALQAAFEAVEACDLFLSIGTSSVVQPAASFIQQAARRGAATAEINLEPTPISHQVDWSVRARSGEALPAIMALLFAMP